MHKKELIQQVMATNPHGTKASEVETIVSNVFDVIQQALVSGEPVVITGFGKFENVERKATTGRNPRTGESVSIPARQAVKFSPGKALKTAVNE